MIFRLSPILGGRSEVMDAPFIELLSHISMLKEKEKTDRFAAFMNMFYANPMTDQQARKEYIKSIQPDSELLQKVSKQGALKTDLDQLKLIKEMQELEAKQMKGG